MSGNRRRKRSLDRRVKRTRDALIEAFNHLFLNRRQRKIKVADIVEQAKVGRSTFYEHYRGAAAVEIDAMAPLMAILADAATGQGHAGRVERVLAHFWENRQRARDLLKSHFRNNATRLLADQIETRLAGAELTLPARLAALQLAEAMLSPIGAWLTGVAPCRPNALAQSLCRSGARLSQALKVEVIVLEPVDM